MLGILPSLYHICSYLFGCRRWHVHRARHGRHVSLDHLFGHRDHLSPYLDLCRLGFSIVFGHRNPDRGGGPLVAHGRPYEERTLVSYHLEMVIWHLFVVEIALYGPEAHHGHHEEHLVHHPRDHDQCQIAKKLREEFLPTINGQ